MPDRGAQWPIWEDATTYHYTLHLIRRGWAWEFLRRNPTFQNELAHAASHMHFMDQASPPDMISSSVDLSRWGVLFRGFIAI